MNRLVSLFNELKGLKLPAGDYAIFGSGPLIVRGIIPASNDLDILCRRQAWETVQELGEPEYLSDYDVTVVTMCDGRLSFGTEWGIGNFDINALIDSAELIEDLPFVRLEYVAGYKEIRRSSKDLDHLDALETYKKSIS